MGLDNRDYVHDSSGYDGFGGGGAPGGAAPMSPVAKLTAGVGIVYVIGLLIPDVAHHLTLSWDGLTSGKIWQLFTYAVVPPGAEAGTDARTILSQASNSGSAFISFAFALLFIYQFGNRLLERVGAREFFSLIAVAVLAGGLVAVPVALFVDRSIDAEVAANPEFARQLDVARFRFADVWTIANVALAWVGLRFMHQRTMFFGIIPMTVGFFAAVVLAFHLVPTILSSPVHAFPALASIAVAVVHERKNLRFAGLADAAADWKRQRSRPKLRVVRPEPEEDADFDEQVDAVLSKLGREGEASLTAKERRLLKQASKRYKDRV